MNNDMIKKNKKKGVVSRRLLSLLLAFNLFIATFSGIVFFDFETKVAKAADGDVNTGDITITHDNKPFVHGTDNPYELRDATLQLGMKTASGIKYEDKNQYQVTWTDEANTGFVDVTTGSSQTTGIITAKSPGTVTITVTVFDKTGGGLAAVDSQTCVIDVKFAIDTSLTGFKKVYEDDERKALVMYAYDNTKLNETNLKPIFGDASKVRWETENTEVATVDSNGKIKAVGAGLTRVKASITPEGSSQEKSDEVEVYVIPEASKTNGSGYASSKNDFTLDSGESFYTDTLFNNGIQGIRSKIFWEVRVESGVNRIPIANSLGLESDLITVESTGNNSSQNGLAVSGVAGEYYIYLYVYNYAHRDKINEIYDSNTYTPTVVNLTIKSPIKDKNVTLGIGDKLDLPASYNMTASDFSKYFSVACTVDGVPAVNYVDRDVSNNVLTALKETKPEHDVKVTMTAKSDADTQKTLKKLLGLDPDNDNLPNGGVFVTTVTIVDGITLGEEKVSLMLGQEYQLTANLHGTYSGSIKWNSSDPTSVSVDNTGLIKGLKVTTKDVTVTASVTVAGGIERTASCIVMVENAMTDFTLNPAGDKFMNVGDVLTIEAKIKETVSKAPLRWISSKESVFTVNAAADGKTAVINAIAGGTGTLMVENTLNGKRVQIDITVRVPITDLKFKEDMFKFPYYQNGHLMLDELEYKPNDATTTALKWEVDNKSVAEIDSAGYLKFKAPGTVSIMCRPEHNPNNLYATAIVRIVGGPEDIQFTNLKDDHLDIEVSESKTVNLKFTPETAETKLSWSQSKAGMVTLDYDETKRDLKVTGRKVGDVTVTCRTDENVYYSFTVTIKQASTGLEFKQDSITIYRGDPLKGTFDLNTIIKMIPETSTDTVTFESRDTKIATVDKEKGIVTGVAAGKTYIIATTSSGRANTIDVYVVDRVTAITAEAKNLVVYIGEQRTITPTVAPSSATNKSIEWSWEPFDTDGSAAIEMEERGSSCVVSGKSPGIVMLHGVSVDNSSVTVTYVLNVKYRKTQYSTKVTLSPKTKYLNVGKTFTVSRSVKNAYKGNKKLKWKSSNTKIATVSSKGKVKAKKVGKVTITATAQDGSKAKGTMKVVVRRLVTKIKMSRSTASVMVGKSIKLSVKYTPSNATVKGVSWKSGDKSIATVDGGKVIGIAAGIVKITATSKDATKKKTTCWVTVREPVPVTNFTITDTSITIAKGSTAQSGIVPNPVNATDSIKYQSDNPGVASVSKKGKITAKRVGHATIYARAANGVEGHVDVTVVDLNRKAVTLRQYDKEQLSVNLISTGVTWYSANPNIAKVDASGMVTARMPGKTVIYANIDGVKLGCRITVKRIS